MTTWQERVKSVFGPKGYDNSTMRRSLQAVVLYEAKRCASKALATMKPFQRKAAFLDQCRAFVESLDILYPHQRAEVLWRTATSKEQMDGEIAWKRAKSVEKELEGLALKIKPFVHTAKSHQEAVDLLVQSLYETLTGFKGKSFPENWEHAHNQNILCFRVYYRYDVLDPTFPEAVSPRDLVVPTVRPEKTMSAPALKTTALSAVTVPFQAIPTELQPEVDVVAFLGDTSAVPRPALEERRRLLEEVRAHLDLLKEFEGAVPESEINQRKRELFAILPSLNCSTIGYISSSPSIESTNALTSVSQQLLLSNPQSLTKKMKTNDAFI